MKAKTIFIISGIAILIIVISLVVARVVTHRQQVAQDPAAARLASMKQLIADSEDTPDISIKNGFPTFVDVNIPVEGQDPVERARNYLSTYQDFYGQADPALALEVLKVAGDDNQIVTFYQTYRGLLVYGSGLVVFVDGDSIHATVGEMLPEGLSIDTQPVLTEAEAVERARTELQAPQAVLEGTTRPMVFVPAFFEDTTRPARLAWRVALNTGDLWNVFVDAENGAILYKDPFTINSYELDLEDANNNNAGSTCYWFTHEHEIGNEDGFTDGNYLSEPYPSELWWDFLSAYAYFWDTFTWDSIDERGQEIQVYAYADVDNAQWKNGCELFEFKEGFVAFDIVIHEFTHGIIAHTSQLAHSGEGGSVNEAFADTMAMGANWSNWTLGEDLLDGSGSQRDYSNATVKKISEVDPSKDKYNNMGVIVTAGYQLSEGGTWGTGIGRQNMVFLFWNTMINLWSGSGFMATRDMAVVVAEGYMPPEDICKVKNAFEAVELGDGDMDCDGIPNQSDPWDDRTPYPFENDIDKDTIKNDVDNCLFDQNPGQENLDGDLLGDACDPDDDEDYTPDVSDNCPRDPNPFQEDNNGNGVGDACDVDDDSDTIWDVNDNCPLVSNFDQDDTNQNGIGDACDDDDQDKRIGAEDNCPFVANPYQENMDHDGLGDKCDPDADGDGYDELNANNGVLAGVCESLGDWRERVNLCSLAPKLDNCIYVYNPDQNDTDGDGFGDACDPCPTVAQDMAYKLVMSEWAIIGVQPHYEAKQVDENGNFIGGACYALSRTWDRDLVAVDGSSVETVLTNDPNEKHSLPLPACPYDEDNYYSQDMGARLTIDTEGSSIGLWVREDNGVASGRQKLVDGKWVLDFIPSPDASYFLSYAFPPDAQTGETLPVTISMLCSPDLPDLSPAPPSNETVPESTTVTPIVTPVVTPMVTVGEAPVFTPGNAVNCRQGPSVYHGILGVTTQGSDYPLAGVSEDGSWYFIQLTEPLRCWVKADTGQARGDLSGLERIHVDLISPTPRIPTITPESGPPPSFCSQFAKQECVENHGDVCQWIGPNPGGYCTAK